jgi:hypothetical protein
MNDLVHTCTHLGLVHLTWYTGLGTHLTWYALDLVHTFTCTHERGFTHTVQCLQDIRDSIISLIFSKFLSDSQQIFSSLDLVPPPSALPFLSQPFPTHPFSALSYPPVVLAVLPCPRPLSPSPFYPPSALPSPLLPSRAVSCDAPVSYFALNLVLIYSPFDPTHPRVSLNTFYDEDSLHTFSIFLPILSAQWTDGR